MYLFHAEQTQLGASGSLTLTDNLLNIQTRNIVTMLVLNSR